jgi:hypothetical protein
MNITSVQTDNLAVHQPQRFKPVPYLNREGFKLYYEWWLHSSRDMDSQDGLPATAPGRAQLLIYV